MTSTFWPAATRPWSRTACSAVVAEIGRAAAWTAVRPAGRGATFFSLATAYSANVPSPMPNTSSPGRTVVTPSPTASTRPANSRPRTGLLGRAQPEGQPGRVGLAGHEVPDAAVDAGRRHPHEHLARHRARAGRSPPCRSTSPVSPYTSWTTARIVAVPGRSAVARCSVFMIPPTSLAYVVRLTLTT